MTLWHCTKHLASYFLKYLTAFTPKRMKLLLLYLSLYFTQYFEEIYVQKAPTLPACWKLAVDTRAFVVVILAIAT